MDRPQFLKCTLAGTAVLAPTRLNVRAGSNANDRISTWNDGREHTDTFHALLEYPEGFLSDWGMGLGNSTGVHFAGHGAKGTLDVERWTVTCEAAGPRSAKPVIFAG